MLRALTIEETNPELFENAYIAELAQHRAQLNKIEIEKRKNKNG